MTDATTAKLSEIVRRLEEAKGPDFVSDRDILMNIDTLEDWDWSDPPKYTASLDAAISLVERVLPGANASVHFDFGHARPPYGKARIAHHKIGDGDTEFVTDWMPTPALALLLAAMKALEKEKQ